MLKRKPNLPNASSRRCLVCGIEKPLAADYFQIVPSIENGFTHYCNDCGAESIKRKTLTLEGFKVDIIDEAEP